MILVACHQPNFLPWLGYFDKIVRSDIFVLLDDVQFNKTGGTWMNRVKIIKNGAADWITAPVDRAYHGLRTILEMQFQSGPWRQSLLARLDQTYSRAPYFREGMDLVRPLIERDTRSVAEFNIQNLIAILDWLGAPSSKLRRSSDYGLPTTSNERLVDLTLAVGGDAYMAGGGAQGYQDEAVFQAGGVQLTLQAFKPHPYPQFNATEFVPGLSFIDAMMNVGRQGVRDLLQLGQPVP